MTDLATIPAGTHPGGIVTRLVCDTCGQLVETIVTDGNCEASATGDAEITRVHIDETGHVVRLHAYDGDSGVCLITVVVS